MLLNEEKILEELNQKNVFDVNYIINVNEFGKTIMINCEMKN
jgi:hypothetical protein